MKKAHQWKVLEDIQSDPVRVRGKPDEVSHWGKRLDGGGDGAHVDWCQE